MYSMVLKMCHHIIKFSSIYFLLITCANANSEYVKSMYFHSCHTFSRFSVAPCPVGRFGCAALNGG